MLYKLRVANYKSIQDTTLSLEWDGKRKPKNYSAYDSLLFIEEGKRRAVPLVVIYGANSSGKSTLLSALATLVSLIRNGVGSVKYTPDRLISVDGTSFTTEIVSGDRLYSHSITYNESEILSESLSEDGRVLFSIEKGILREGKADESAFTSDGRQVYSSLSSSSSPFRDAIAGRVGFFNPFAYSVSDAFERYVTLSGKCRKECLEDVRSLSLKLDLSVEDIKDGDVWQTEHTGCDSRGVWLSLDEESEGTKRLFALTSVILAALSSGSILVIDEIDVSLHSIVLRQMVSLFLDKRYNTTGAQLICSSHNTDLLDAPFVQKSEIAFFEKTKKRGSCVTRLSEIEGVKSLSAFRSDYLEGRFSGIPFSYI